MKAMLLGFVAIIVIAIGASNILGTLGYSSSDRYSGAAVRN
ncbi:hypothetical protein [Aliiroseovarius sp. PrR006]|nr:hypothetical protein [Aliiroseovarius sp. PrR006]